MIRALNRCLWNSASSFFAVGLSTLVAASPALADIAPEPLSGGESFGSPTGAAYVAMAEETVTLKVGRKECRTVAVFQMKNLSDNDVTMRVGFPVFHTTDLLDFEASVEGDPVKVTGHPKTRRGRGWKLWEMTFPASKTTEVVVSYRHELSQRYSWGIGALYEDLGRHVKDAAKEEELAPLKGRFVKHDVHYILRTGRGWAGPIGRCRIEVEFQDGLSLDNVLLGLPRAMSGLPPGGNRVPEEKRVTAKPKTTKDSIVWELKNFEPDRDVAIACAGTTNKETHQLLEKIHKRDPYDPMIARYLGEFRVNATGDPVERHAINQEILQMWQDRIAIWGPDSEDALKLRHSREVFSLMRAVTGAYSKDMAAPKPQSVEPVIRKICQRLEEQMKLAEPNSRTVKLYQPQIQKTLIWCAQNRAK